MQKLLIDLPEYLVTPRLEVRPYRSGDGAAYYDVCQRNRSHLLPYEQGNPALDVQTPEDAEILVRHFAAEWVSHAAFFLGAWARSDGAFVAQIYVGVVSWALPEFEVGYFGDVNHGGQGYVTEAVRHAALPLVFDVLGGQRARINCNETNVRSWHIAERCGFRREGHLRATRPHLTLEDGSPSGDFIYGLLRSEFEKMRGSRN